MCPDNPDEYRRAKGIYEKISGWNEQTETEAGTGEAGCQNGKSTGKGQRKRKKLTARSLYLRTLVQMKYISKSYNC